MKPVKTASLLSHQQIRPWHPAVPGLGRLSLSHERWFLLPVVGVQAALWRRRDVSTGVGCFCSDMSGIMGALPPVMYYITLKALV